MSDEWTNEDEAEMTIKPHTEYRASRASKIEKAQAKKSADIRAALDDPKALAKLQADVAFIVIRRPIEYRPSPKAAKQLDNLAKIRDAQAKAAIDRAVLDLKAAPDADAKAELTAKLILDGMDVGKDYAKSAFIVIRRDRAKYNAYMRAYRAKKKAAKA